ncbi:MAG: hypothetical protein WBK55_07175 [Alphaproteobacteria bacterium]
MRIYKILFFVIAVTPFLSACNGFVGRGQDGAVQEPRENQVTETNGENLPKKPPECGKTFIVSGRAAKGVVDCEKVNYQDVYQRAKDMTQAQLNELTCPANCSPLKFAETARIWNCVRPDDNAPPMATSTVEQTALCPPAEGGPVLPPPLPPVPANDFTDDKGVIQDLTMQPGIIEDAADGAQVNCPSTRIVRVDHQDISPKTCRRTRFDYEPYVLRATSVAEQEWNSFTCAPGCTKVTPFSTLRRRWGCSREDNHDNLVEVQIWYSVQCKPTGD